LLKKYI